jgi:hypothetical protein
VIAALCKMPKPALEKMPRGEFSRRHIVGKNSREFGFRAALEKLDDRLARLAIHLRQSIVVNLADDSVGIPILEPSRQVFAGMAVDAAINAEEPGQIAEIPPGNSGAVEVAVARGGDDPAQYAARVGKLRWQHECDMDEFGGSAFSHGGTVRICPSCRKDEGLIHSATSGLGDDWRHHKPANRPPRKVDFDGVAKSEL